MNPGNAGGDAGERPELHLTLVEEMGAGRRSTDSMIPPIADWSPFTVSPTVRLPPPPEGRSVNCGFLAVGGWQTGGRGRDGGEGGSGSPSVLCDEAPVPLPAPCSGFGGTGGPVEGGWTPTPLFLLEFGVSRELPIHKPEDWPREGRCGGWWSEDGWGNDRRDEME